MVDGKSELELWAGGAAHSISGDCHTIVLGVRVQEDQLWRHLVTLILFAGCGSQVFYLWRIRIGLKWSDGEVISLQSGLYSCEGAGVGSRLPLACSRPVGGASVQLDLVVCHLPRLLDSWPEYTKFLVINVIINIVFW